jgi:predicted metal-dependent phosphoesterase TrpH
MDTKKQETPMKTQKLLYMDLHTHTFYSDGLGTPELNVRTARTNGIEILAITDHDKIEGYEEARIAGEQWQVQVVPGVEISTDKYHILGLGVDINNAKLREFLDYSAEEQKKVCEKRISQLQSRGVPITLEKVMKIFPKSRLGKMNILYTMTQDKESQDYFMKIEGQKISKPLYDAYLRDENGRWVEDKMTSVTSKMAIDVIHEAGGIAVIAHPAEDVKDMAEMNILLENGIDGIEYQQRYNGENEKFMKFAEDNNLLITYGSDYHGGVFGRMPLDNKGKNILDERLAIALRLKL